MAAPRKRRRNKQDIRENIGITPKEKSEPMETTGATSRRDDDPRNQNETWQTLSANRTIRKKGQASKSSPSPPLTDTIISKPANKSRTISKNTVRRGSTRTYKKQRKTPKRPKRQQKQGNPLHHKGLRGGTKPMIATTYK